MASRPVLPALEPEELRSDLLGLDPGLRRQAYCGERFGQPPRRSPKGGFIDLAGYDLTRLGGLTPHPGCAWMGWVQILSPSRPQHQPLRPLLAESLQAVKAKWAQRTAG